MTAVVEKLIQAATAVTCLTRAQLLGPSREQHISSVRQIIMYLAIKQGKSSPVIGAALNRDHTTVLHGRKAIAARLENGNRRIELLVSEIREKANGDVQTTG